MLLSYPFAELPALKTTMLHRHSNPHGMIFSELRYTLFFIISLSFFVILSLSFLGREGPGLELLEYTKCKDPHVVPIYLVVSSHVNKPLNLISEQFSMLSKVVGRSVRSGQSFHTANFEVITNTVDSIQSTRKYSGY